MKNLKARELVLCSLFVALIIVGTFIRIPIPVLPFTLQLLFTMLAGLLLGPELGTICVLVYIILGLIGLPVFTEGGGFGYIFKPTFGYILGFAVGAYATGKIANKEKRPDMKRLLTANFVGLAIVYIFGMVYYYFISNFYLASPIGVKAIIIYCFLLAVPGDIFLCFVGAFLGKRLIPIVNKSYN
ncbi:biotin transporter BioY [Peptoniphilus hominis (ex Hitch et al. 2025)]|uniref:Biotin transporter n=1 Tax=Peptoniphilus hominis (ex Hitch et al. 2025) TaxID=3133174 RepID=A0ABV1CE75_9FIRM